MSLVKSHKIISIVIAALIILAAILTFYGVNKKSPQHAVAVNKDSTVTTFNLNPSQQALVDKNSSSEKLNEQSKPKTPAISFADGVWQVGIDIKPGIYKTSGASDCYYARLSGFDTNNDIISNNNTNGPATVQIYSTDKAFQSSGCGTWVLEK